MPSSRITHKQSLPPPPNYWFGLLFVGFQAIIIAATWMVLPPQLPLFYSLPYGMSRLVNKELLLMIPGLSLAMWGTGLGWTKVNINSPIFRHIQFWMIQLVLFLHTIALVHSILIVI